MEKLILTLILTQFLFQTKKNPFAFHLQAENWRFSPQFCLQTWCKVFFSNLIKFYRVCTLQETYEIRTSARLHLIFAPSTVSVREGNSIPTWVGPFDEFENAATTAGLEGGNSDVSALPQISTRSQNSGPNILQLQSLKIHPWTILQYTKSVDHRT